MAFDPGQIFGQSTRQEPDNKVSIAVLLKFLADLLSAKKEDDEMLDEREQDAREIPVRPRIEPLGGA